MRSFLFVVPMMAVAGIALAQTDSKRTDFKIAYVDMARALNEVEDGKTAKARLKAEFEEKQKQLDKLQNDLKTKKEEFDKKASMMNPEVKQQKQEELQNDFLKLQRTYMELQKDLSDRESQVTLDIANKIRRIVNMIGDRDSYALVLDIGSGVLHYKRHLDITDEVVREYNRQHAGSAQAPAKSGKK